jgi:hypothetical protein
MRKRLFPAFLFLTLFSYLALGLGGTNPQTKSGTAAPEQSFNVKIDFNVRVCSLLIL